MPNDVKRQQLLWNQNMQKYQRRSSESVLWAEYDPVRSERDAVYEEGSASGGRVWFPPVQLPVMNLDFDQDPSKGGDEGFYLISNMRVVFTVFDAVNRFHVDPEATGQHFRDRFSYNNSVFTVLEYEKQGGPILGRYFTIAVLGRQVKEEEFWQDVVGKDFFTATYTR